MPARRRALSAVTVTAVAVSLFALQSPSAGAAGPAPSGSAPAQLAAARAAAGTGPAWLTRLREHAVRQVDAGRKGPFGPNPALSLVPEPERQDWGGWRSPDRATKQTSRQAKALRAAAGVVAPRFVREDEPAGTRGANDTFRSAQRLGTFGTRKGADRAVTVLGRLSPAPLPPLEALPPNREDDGDLDTARDTGVSRERGGFTTTGTIGDAPPQPGDPDPADADLYKLTLRAGELVEVELQATSGNLMPAAFLVDANGQLVAFSEDTETASTISTAVRAAGTYYVVALGYTLIDLDTGTTTRTEGGYTIGITARAGDRDLYAVTLQGGDVLGVSVEGAANYVSVYEPTGTEVHGSPVDYSAAYPADSPLPGGGNAVTDHVARSAGTHYVEVTAGSGRYEAQLEVYRYGGAVTKQTQTIFLDTNGQRLNTNVFGGRGVTTLSPLRSFLGRWGLPRSAERALVDRIKATVKENLESDLRAARISRYVDVKVVSNFDTRDVFGRAGVTRVIVGGTIEESGISTIGIAQSIDPGNFEREESALVLLDAMSEPGGDETPYSLNTYLTPASNRLAFVGRAVGNVVSHEVGHVIGNWHVDEQNTRANLMDAGGNFPLLYGVGPDGIGGTRDDPDVDFGRDRFNLFEGYTGIEDTMARSVWGMSTRP